MTPSVKRHIAFIQLLASCSKHQTTALISSMSKEQMNVLCEMLLNVQYGTIKLTEQDKKKLQRKKNIIRKLTTKTTTRKVRKSLLQREPALIKFVSNLVLKHVN